MEIFIDSANLAEIRLWLEYGVVDGVTTNPSILLKDGGFDMEARAKKIAELAHPRPVSVEVTTNDREEMVVQAAVLARWAPNIVVKIPVINEHGEPCLGVAKALEEEGIKVNVTACMSFGQVALAAKVRASYISIFAGRVADEGHDASRLIRQSVDWLKEWNYPAKIIIGSIREVINIQDAALAGAHVITIPPQFMGKLVDHKYTRSTVKEFVSDAQKALASAQGLKVLVSG